MHGPGGQVSASNVWAVSQLSAKYTSDARIGPRSVRQAFTTLVRWYRPSPRTSNEAPTDCDIEGAQGRLHDRFEVGADQLGLLGEELTEVIRQHNSDFIPRRPSTAGSPPRDARDVHRPTRR